MRTYQTIWLLCAVLILGSCSKDIIVPEPPSPSDRSPLSFTVDMASGLDQTVISIDSVQTRGYSGSSLTRTNGENIGSAAATKAAPVEDMTKYGSFSLYGYLYDSWSAGVKPEFMKGEKVSYAGSKWTTANSFSTRLGDKTLRFYGYAPYSAAGVSVSSGMSGPIGFTYSVPSSVAAQNDLLVGASGEYSGELSDLSVSFSHCLSAITFRTGTETVDGTIRSISLKGIYSKGDYVYGTGWSNLSTKTNFSYSSDIPVTEGSTKAITSGDATMMLIPQTLPAGAAIEVVIESEGKIHTLSASIAGDTWQEGKKCVYSLSFDSIAGMKISLDVSSLTLDWGESYDITVTGDPLDQNWTNEISGTGLSAQKINSTTLRVTNNNISGADSYGLLTVTTGDSKRQAQVSITARSLQESISLSPSSKTIAYGATEDFTASGTYPNGFSTDSPAGTSVTKSGNTISVRNTNTSYTATDVTLTARTGIMEKTASVSIHLDAKPETIMFDRSSLTVGTSGNGTIKVSGDYDSFTAALSSTDYAALSKDGNTLTITNRNTSFESRTVTLTATTSGDTKATASATITLSPMEDYVTDYIISDVTLSKASVGAGGGTITISGGTVTQVWASGKRVDSYATATFKVERTEDNNIYPASLSGNTITVSNLKTKVTAQGTYTVTASYSASGLSAESRTVQFTQAANEIANGNYNPSSTSYTASISIGDGITAGGGSAVITYSASHTAYNQYTSGSTDASRHTVYDEAAVTITANGNSAFTLSGSTTGSGSSNECTVTHADMKSNVRTDNLTVKVTNKAKTTKTASKSTSVSNALETTHYKNTSGDVGDNESTTTTLKAYGTPTISIGNGLSAAGGSATVSASVTDTYTVTGTKTYYQRYTSGTYTSKKTDTVSEDQGREGSVTLTLQTNGNSRFSLSGTTLSHNSMGKNVTTDNVTVRARNANSTTKYKDASKSISNSRYTGTIYTKNHTRTGSVTYGSKTYGSTTYGAKSYGSEYLSNTDWGSQITDSDTYGSWSTYSTGTDKYDYYVSFSSTSWSPGSDASSQSNTITAYHYERTKNDQRRTITHNYHQSYTDHYYRDYTRSASRTYSRTASQKCNYVEYHTDTFDSGDEEYVEEAKSHTESWTDSGTENLPNDTGSEWYRDSSGTSYGTSDGGYDYRTTYGTGSKKTDSVTPTSSQTWLSYSGGTMSVSANPGSDSRSATLTVVNGDDSATCSVTQGGAEYDIVIN